MKELHYLLASGYMKFRPALEQTTLGMNLKYDETVDSYHAVKHLPEFDPEDPWL